MNNKNIDSVYIIGIGGKGLNSMAEFCLSKGYRVSGSDCKDSPEVCALRHKGVSVYLDQTGEHVTRAYSLVVYSAIIDENHPERLKANELGIPQMSRAQFLGYITKDFVRVSVAGSHGKSTTSALATLALKSELGKINSITGAYIKELKSYQDSGDSPYCVVEACEYGKSFLHLPGDYTLITALEKSHMEFFGNEEMMDSAFRDFVSVHKEEATLIINGDIPKLRTVCANHKGRVVTCGFNLSNDYVLRDVRLHKGHSVFSIYRDGKCVAKNILLKVPGTYNMLNVGLVFVLMESLSLPTQSLRDVLENFLGVGRRFELQIRDTATFVDDFAHHPTQVKNLLGSIRQFFPDKKILAVFEPRQYHLFKTFLKEYGSAFKCAEEVYVTDIVPALGDTASDISSLSVEDVISSVKTYSKPNRVGYVRSYQEIADKLALRDLSDMVVATIGAGPIFKVRDLLLNSVK